MRYFLLLFLVLFALPLTVAAGKPGENKKILTSSLQASSRYESVQNYQDAVRALLPLVKAYPQKYMVHARLGWLYFLQGKYSNSIEHYNMASRVRTGAIEPVIGRMLPLLGQERYAYVEQEAYKILRIDFYNYYANLRLVIALRKQKKDALAMKVVRRMLKLYPADTAFLVQKGLVYEQSGSFVAARKVFLDVVALDQENGIAKQFFLRNNRTGKIVNTQE